MIIERKFGELKDGDEFVLDANDNERYTSIKDYRCEYGARWKDGSCALCYTGLTDDTTVYQIVSDKFTREEQIALLKSIEKPFGLWKPEWLKECDVVRELKDEYVWEWYDDGSWFECRLEEDKYSHRLSPDYQDPPKEEKPKEPEKAHVINISVDLELCYDPETRKSWFSTGKVTKVVLE